MQKRIFTLILVAIVGILAGLAVVKKQVREPLLREIIRNQRVLLQSQAKIEKKINEENAIVEAKDSPTMVKLQDLETRLAALETQVKGLQEVAKARPGNVPQGPPPEDPNKVYTIPVAHSPVKGNKKAAVTIVEFVDFQCPFCARFHPPIQEALKAYPKDVKYVLKNFPLSFHAQAKPAAKAALAAGEQGKYWEMADAILEKGKPLSEKKYEELAKDIGLDVKKFKDDYKNKDKEWEKYIQDDMDLAQQVNVRGTPTFYINGKKTNARDFNGWKKEIDQILNKEEK